MMQNKYLFLVHIINKFKEKCLAMETKFIKPTMQFWC